MALRNFLMLRDLILNIIYFEQNQSVCGCKISSGERMVGKFQELSQILVLIALSPSRSQLTFLFLYRNFLLRDDFELLLDYNFLLSYYFLLVAIEGIHILHMHLHLQTFIVIRVLINNMLGISLSIRETFPAHMALIILFRTQRFEFLGC